jgi:hypothetical protein
MPSKAERARLLANRLDFTSIGHLLAAARPECNSAMALQIVDLAIDWCGRIVSEIDTTLAANPDAK